MMSNTLDISGFKAVVTYDPDIDMIRGEFIGLNGGADFYASDIKGLRKEGATSLNPHFSSLVYCVAAIIRPGCVMLGRPPRRTVKVRLRRPRSQALPGRRLRRLATTTDEKSGLRSF